MYYLCHCKDIFYVSLNQIKMYLKILNERQSSDTMKNNCTLRQGSLISAHLKKN